MRKPAFLLASMTLAMVLACTMAVLMGTPGAAQTATEGPVTLVGAGDIASCAYNRDEATAKVLSGILAETSAANIPTTVFTLGDDAYPSGTRAQFANCYDNYFLSDGSTYDSSRSAWWGQFKARTMPSLGNHEYLNSTDPTNISKPYFDYFSAQNGFKAPAAPVPSPGLVRGEGYYSYDAGSWHVIVLNSNCSEVGGCGASSSQGQWLQADLTNHPASCTLAYWHHPLFSSADGASDVSKPFWDILYTEGADVILSGHSHYYERFAPQDPQGNLDATYGIREIVSGTGGAEPVNPIHTPRAPNSEKDSFKAGGGTAYGVLKLDLSTNSYHWEFRPVANDTFSDSGSGDCHGAPASADTTAPTVSSVAPTDGATGVPVTTNAEAIFSEAMDPSTINDSNGASTTFTLSKQGSTTPSVTAHVSYDPATRKATLNPDADLDYNSIYVASISGAKDVAGNTLDQDPNTLGDQDKTWSFTTVASDTTPPDTIIDTGPSGTVRKKDATFTFHSTEPNGSTFTCRLDTRAWEPCNTTTTSTTSSTYTVSYTGLTNGSHTFRVYATDAAGNQDLTPASRSWKVRAK